MIDCRWAHVATITVARMQNTYSAKNNIKFVTQLIIRGITHGPQVDQLVIGTASLAYSLMMMRLCRHYWDMQNYQQCT